MELQLSCKAACNGFGAQIPLRNFGGYGPVFHRPGAPFEQVHFPHEMPKTKDEEGNGDRSRANYKEHSLLPSSLFQLEHFRHKEAVKVSDFLRSTSRGDSRENVSLSIAVVINYTSIPCRLTTLCRINNLHGAIIG